MKRVSFKVAKAIKQAGYPQSSKPIKSYNIKGELEPEGSNYKRGKRWDAPTYLEVWLWLWREKHIAVEADYSFANDNWFDGGICGDKFNDPEDAIIAAIEYLVTNNLIK